MALSNEQKEANRYAKKLIKLNTELCVARINYPNMVSKIEIKIHQHKMKYLGKNYLEEMEADRERLRRERSSRKT